MGVLLYICCIFSKYLFTRTSTERCFYSFYLNCKRPMHSTLNICIFMTSKSDRKRDIFFKKWGGLQEQSKVQLMIRFHPAIPPTFSPLFTVIPCASEISSSHLYCPVYPVYPGRKLNVHKMYLQYA